MAITPESGPIFDGLQEYIEACKEIDDYRIIEDADWNEEIGALIEAVAESIPNPPMLIFDKVKDYPPGYRLVALSGASYKRAALALGLPTDKSRGELSKMGAEKLKTAQPIPPTEVTAGPVMENVMEGDEVDLLHFPVPRYHAKDGGRYIGTGDSLINMDPDTGFVNMGTYRMEVHDKNTLGLWMSPGQHGRLICQSYWDKGEACPVVATFGSDPLTWMAAHTMLPWGKSELEHAGALRGRPVDVIKGPITGLPIPSNAEIAIEGEVPPPWVESRDEGPFGEWPGYYSGGTLGTGEPQPVIRVKAVYYRNNPMILSQAPMWPGAQGVGLSIGMGRGGLADLQRAGIQGVSGVGVHMGYIRVVALDQRYVGHVKQAAHTVLANTRNGRWIVMVDDDIDPDNLTEVLWAMTTRCDPATDIEIVNGLWSTPLDPLVSASPEKRDSGDHTNSVAIYYATRPFHRKDTFPGVSRSPKELRNSIIEKYRDILPFPTS